MAKEKTFSEYTDTNQYLYRWLAEKPPEKKSDRSFEIDLDKRLDTILTALHKAEESNVIRLKQRKK
ncbi:MAG: hypothetical protein HY889_09550 [Deltaproteobacteria bacterium]|nr:hypothetical protein [Deltaproteobacteria bacterium]